VLSAIDFPPALKRPAYRLRFFFLRSDFVHEDFASMVYVMREYCGGADFAIRQWAEARNAAPATAGESGRGNGIGVLRMDFPGYGGKRLKKVSWSFCFRNTKPTARQAISSA